MAGLERIAATAAMAAAGNGGLGGDTARTVAGDDAVRFASIFSTKARTDGVVAQGESLFLFVVVVIVIVLTATVA